MTTKHVFVVTLETDHPVSDLIDLVAMRSLAIPGVVSATAAAATAQSSADEIVLYATTT